MFLSENLKGKAIWGTYEEENIKFYVKERLYGILYKRKSHPFVREDVT
jgi:hypothetical protein